VGSVSGGIEVEVLGAELTAQAPPLAQVGRLCQVAAAAGGVEDGHVAVEFVDSERISELNAEHRAKEGPTDVLSFPIDCAPPGARKVPAGGNVLGDGRAPDDGGAPRELGDVVICPEHTEDLCEAIVHGVLHLVGMDHETDAGEMLAVQAELLRWERL
jgi:probable rRNA maturation factor